MSMSCFTFHADKETLDNLNNTIYDLLIKLTPTSRSNISRFSARPRSGVVCRTGGTTQYRTRDTPRRILGKERRHIHASAIRPFPLAVT